MRQDFLYSLPYDCYSTVMGAVYGLCNFLDNSGHTLLSQLGAAVEGTAEAIYSSDKATMTTEMEHRGLPSGEFDSLSFLKPYTPYKKKNI